MLLCALSPISGFIVWFIWPKCCYNSIILTQNICLSSAWEARCELSVHNDPESNNIWFTFPPLHFTQVIYISAHLISQFMRPYATVTLIVRCFFLSICRESIFFYRLWGEFRGDAQKIQRFKAVCPSSATRWHANDTWTKVPVQATWK